MVLLAVALAACAGSDQHEQACLLCQRSSAPVWVVSRHCLLIKPTTLRLTAATAAALLSLATLLLTLRGALCMAANSAEQLAWFAEQLFAETRDTLPPQSALEAACMTWAVRKHQLQSINSTSVCMCIASRRVPVGFSSFAPPGAASS